MCDALLECSTTWRLVAQKVLVVSAVNADTIDMDGASWSSLQRFQDSLLEFRIII